MCRFCNGTSKLESSPLKVCDNDRMVAGSNVSNARLFLWLRNDVAIEPE